MSVATQFFKGMSNNNKLLEHQNVKVQNKIFNFSNKQLQEVHENVFEEFKV